MKLHPEFINGATNRRMGVTKTQSAKHLRNDRSAHEERLQNRDGWEAMHVYLALQNIDSDVSKAEQVGGRDVLPHQRILP